MINRVLVVVFIMVEGMAYQSYHQNISTQVFCAQP
jgi:hypothetical protein